MAETESGPQNKYGRYHVPDGVRRRPAVRAILSGQVYEPDTIDFMCRHAGKGDIIHAGAFFGDFLPALSQSVAPGAKVWAFEPNPANFDAAQKTVALNTLKNVELANAALSNRRQNLLMQTHKPDGLPLGGASRIVSGEGKGVTPVQSVMLDYTVPLDREISILQLDVEGHEKAALRGAYHIIQTWRPILILEFFPKLLWINRMFRGTGYKQIGKLHGNFVYATKQVDL